MYQHIEDTNHSKSTDLEILTPMLIMGNRGLIFIIFFLFFFNSDYNPCVGDGIYKSKPCKGKQTLYTPEK